MDLCPLCESIKDIREKQGKDYLFDLCPECRRKVIIERMKDSQKFKEILLIK